MNKLKKNGKVSVFGAMAIGIGGMVGGGIFAVLGEAVSLAHGATAIAFLVAGAVAFITSYSYAKLSVHYPSQGGTVVFIDKAFGVDLATGVINLILWLSYLVTLALYAVAFGSYALTFFTTSPDPWLRHALISLGIILPVILNLFNAQVVSKSEVIIVFIKLTLLILVIVAGAGYVDVQRFSPSSWGNSISIIGAGMVIFVAYEGFELIANSAQEVKDPKKTLPRAFYGSVLLVIALYVLVALITVGTVAPDRIAQVKDYALAEAAKPALGTVGFRLVAVAALLATLSAINATVYGNARLGFTLAKDGELPSILEEKAWKEPASGVLIVGILALLMANFIDLTGIAIISSAGFLLIFAAVNAAGTKLAAITGGNKWISLIGSIACILALLTLLWHTHEDNPRSLWIFLIFIAIAFIFEISYGTFVRKHLSLDKKSSSK